LQDSLNAREQRLQFPKELLASGSSFVHSAGAQKQFVTQGFTEAFQLPAHCRLAEEAAISSSCDMALFKQHREMDEQIKIELGYMRIAHDRNSTNAQSGGIIEAHAGGDCRT
jgi:hypothetical protein